MYKVVVVPACVEVWPTEPAVSTPAVVVIPAALPVSIFFWLAFWVVMVKASVVCT
jgi:hypothetical protein